MTALLIDFVGADRWRRIQRRDVRACGDGEFVNITPPFIVSIPPECTFYRTVEEASAACSCGDGDVFDARGRRMSATADGLSVSSVEPAELAYLLRRWLGHADAIRESTATWPLWLLVHAAVEHAGYEG